jgi:triphosphatase
MLPTLRLATGAAGENSPMMEIELKLLVSARDAQALRDHPLLQQYATSEPHEDIMSDTYFDTPDLHLRRSDAILRVRGVGNTHWVQTMKGSGSAIGGLHSRDEWESRIAGPVPDLALLRDVLDHKSAWGRLLRSPVIEDRLLPIFTTKVKRMVWELRLPHGDEVEFALDQGKLECIDQKVPISEIELELKSGKPAHLFDFALALQQEFPMQIGYLSKADRGYALFAPKPPAAAKATLLKLTKRMTVEQAFRAIATNCMVQIQANEAGVSQEYDAYDAESLHQMRVGLRRLRSALGLFKDVLQLPEQLHEELNWLAMQLGAARDWDVLVGTTMAAVAAAQPDETGIAEVKLAALNEAQEQHEAAAAAVSSQRYTRLVLDFTRLLQGWGWRDVMLLQDQGRLTAPVTKFARRILVHNHRRLLKRGKKLHGASPAARHRVRIAAKKIRYATEFFQSLYASKNVQPYADALARLQDELGWLNDAAVADRLLTQLQDGQVRLEGGAGFIRGYLAARACGGERKIRKRWEKFTSIKLPC